jgi:hypothetical protein
MNFKASHLQNISKVLPAQIRRKVAIRVLIFIFVLVTESFAAPFFTL